MGKIIVKNHLEPEENSDLSNRIFSASDCLTTESFFTILVKTLVTDPHFSEEEINNFSENEVKSLVNIFGGILGISEEFSLFDPDLPAKEILFNSFQSCYNLYLWASKNPSKKLDIEQWFQHLADSAKQIDSIIYDPLIKSGFWISPNMRMDFHGYLHGLISSGKNSITDIREGVCRYFRVHECMNLYQLVKIWMEDASFNKRQKIIYDALAAHINQKYTLSIPSLLIQFEGITLEKFGLKKPKNNNLLNKFRDFFSQNKTFEYFQKSSIDNFLSLSSPIYSFIDFRNIDYQDWLSQNNLEENQTLQRHALAHGLSWNYDSEENSIRVFLLLDMVACYP